MAEEEEKVGSKLEHAIAQAKKDIETIDTKCEGLQAEAKKLRVEQVEIEEMLLKLEAG